MKETLRPVAVLTGICLIVAVLLAATNGVTAPIIAANEAAAAQQTRIRLLPEADSFDIVPVEAEGVTEAARAANGAGWVITAQAQGYGGQVPVMVAFGQDGAIRAVEFLANDETPALARRCAMRLLAHSFQARPAQTPMRWTPSPAPRCPPTRPFWR